MRLGIDLDGVTANWTHAAREMLNERFELDLDFGEPPYWNWIQDQVTKKQWAWLWTAGVQRGLFSRPQVYPGARMALGKLCDQHDVFFLTDRPKRARADTFMWIAKLGVDAAGLIINKTKTEIECDIFLDDKPDNVVEIQTVFPDASVCLMHRRYNADFVWGNRVLSWEDFVARVESHATT